MLPLKPRKTRAAIETAPGTRWLSFRRCCIRSLLPIESKETQGPLMLRRFSASAPAVALRTGLLRTREASATSGALLSESAATGLLSLESSRGLVDAEALLTARAVGACVSALSIVAKGAVAGSAIGLLSVASSGITLGLPAHVSRTILSLP